MRAVTVVPGTAGSLRIDEVPEPDERLGSVLVEALAVGICGTDIEIADGRYGWPPPERDRLVLGHESLGRVLDPGSIRNDPAVPAPTVTARIRPVPRQGAARCPPSAPTPAAPCRPGARISPMNEQQHEAVERAGSSAPRRPRWCPRSPRAPGDAARAVGHSTGRGEVGRVPKPGARSCRAASAARRTLV